MGPELPAVLAQATGTLATSATRLMEEGLPWYRELSAQQRSWVGLVAQAGIAAFLEWAQDPRQAPELTWRVFGAAPPELAHAISLEQTVALVRATIAVVESAIDELVDPAEQPALREAILRYSREVAFSAAEVYARAAEARGAWDARLESLVVDALLRDDLDIADLDDAVLSRLAALGWGSHRALVVVAGDAPAGDHQTSMQVLRRAAAAHQVDLLTGIHGRTLLAIAGGADDPVRIARILAAHLGQGPVVHSPLVAAFAAVGDAVRSVLSGLRAAPGWPDAPRPVGTHELLPERALLGDAAAAAELIDSVHLRLVGDPALLQTAEAYLERTPSLEGTARALFIHPNTVRYRLRRIAEVTGWSPTDARDATCLRLGLVLGRLAASRSRAIDG